MPIATFTIDGRQYVVIPKDEYLQDKPARPRRRTALKKRPATSKSRPSWLSENWDEAVAKSRANTKRLTGKEHL